MKRDTENFGSDTLIGFKQGESFGDTETWNEIERG